MYKIVLTTHAAKDAKKLKRSHLQAKAADLMQILRRNPFQTPPPYEKMRGIEQTYSRRINDQHRLVYQMSPNVNNEKDNYGFPYQGEVKIISMWMHYE